MKRWHLVQFRQISYYFLLQEITSQLREDNNFFGSLSSYKQSPYMAHIRKDTTRNLSPVTVHIGHQMVTIFHVCPFYDQKWLVSSKASLTNFTIMFLEWS
jgi:hypothetical protein